MYRYFLLVVIQLMSLAEVSVSELVTAVGKTPTVGEPIGCRRVRRDLPLGPPRGPREWRSAAHRHLVAVF